MAKKRGILVKASDYDKATSALRSAGIYSYALGASWKFHLGSAMLGALIVGAIALVMYLT
jgi:hypothetical protein